MHVAPMSQLTFVLTRLCCQNSSYKLILLHKPTAHWQAGSHAPEQAQQLVPQQEACRVAWPGGLACRQHRYGWVRPGGAAEACSSACC